MPDKRRVLYLETSPSLGGSVFSLYDLCRGLNRDRYEPIVVTYSQHSYVERFRQLGIEVVVWNWHDAGDHRPAWVQQQRAAAPVRRLRASAWGRAAYHSAGMGLLLVRRVWPRARSLQRVIEERQASLVHTNIRVGHDREGILAAGLAKVPCVCHIRDDERLGWVDRQLAGRADAFIYISRFLQERHVKSGATRAKGRVVYNGIDVDAFVSGSDRDGGRRSLDLAEDDLSVGLIARLDRWKGHEVFLQAVALLHQILPQVKARIVGGSVPHDPEYRQELEELCRRSGLDGVVQFFDFRPDVARVMSALDLVALASTRPEPFGRVLIEAMAVGRPVVATDAGASREIVDDGVQGLLVPAGDAGALAQAFARILTSPDRGQEMGRQGQIRARDRFGLEPYVRGVEAVYEELLR